MEIKDQSHMDRGKRKRQRVERRATFDGKAQAALYQDELPTTSHENQLKSRYSYDGPAWFERQKTGYKGYAWFDLPLQSEKRSLTSPPPIEKRRLTKSPPPLELGGRKSPVLGSLEHGIVSPKWRHSALGSPVGEVPPWVDHVKADPIARKALIEYDDLMDDEQQQDRHQTVDREIVSSKPMMDDFGLRNSLDLEVKRLDGDETMEDDVELDQIERHREARLRELILQKAEARRAALRTSERILHNYKLDKILKIESPEYHLPRTIAFEETKEVAENVQNCAIRRNWVLIKKRFDSHGGVLTLKQLRQALLHAGITIPHAGRAVLHAAETLLPGEDLVAYDDFMNQHFPSEESYETDSDLEDALSDMEREIDKEEDLDAFPVEQEEDENEKKETDTVQVEDEKIRFLASSTATPLLRKLSQYQVRKSVLLARRETEAMIGEKKNSIVERSMSIVGESYERKVERLKRKIVTAVTVRGIPTGNGAQTAEALMSIAGNSLHFLKKLDKQFIRTKPSRKSSTIIAKGSALNLQNGGKSRPLLSMNSSSNKPVSFHFEKKPGVTGWDDILKSQTSLDCALGVVQCEAAINTQALVRKFLVLRRMVREKHEKIVKMAQRKRDLKVAQVWFDWSQHMQQLRKHVMKPFIRWRGYTRMMVSRREKFRACFWPFYVWRRHTFQMSDAKSKAKFLRRVWLTLKLLRHFRAWKKEMLASKERMMTVLQKIRKDEGQLLIQHFRGWADFAKKEHHMRETWEEKGRALQLRILRFGLVRTWGAWRLFARGQKTIRQRALKYYKNVPEWYEDNVRFYRNSLLMPGREYSTDPVPVFPDMETLVGPIPYGFIFNDPVAREACEKYYMELVANDRIARIVTCIHRNRLGTVVLRQWKELVEEEQKKRYAWHSYVFRTQRKAFQAWFKLVRAKRRPTRRASSIAATNVANKNGGAKRNTLLLAGSKDSKHRKSQRRQSAGAVVVVHGHEETQLSAKDRAVAEVAKRRAAVARMQEERSKTHETWMSDSKKRRQSYIEAKSNALEMRKARVARAERLARHEKRLAEAQENVKESDAVLRNLLDRKKTDLNMRKEQQLRHAQLLHGMRARMLHDAMVNVYTELEITRSIELKHKCFRMLRFPLVVKKSFGMMQKKRLKNWIRICVRLRKLWRAMPKFHILRKKWQIFNKWLQFVDRKYQYETPGLRESLHRRKNLLASYSKLIRMNGEIATEGTMQAWFHRWVEYTQKSSTRKNIVRQYQYRRDLFLLQRVLYGWRFGIKAKYTKELRRDGDGEVEETIEPFRALRAKFDLDRWKCVMVQEEKRLLTLKLRRRNRFIKDQHIYAVRGPDNFERVVLKAVMQRHRELVQIRLDLEARLLSTAFEERGTFSFHDKDVPIVGLKDMELAGGTRFRDEHVPAAVGVHSVLVAVSEGMVVSIQLKMRSGSESTTEKIWYTPTHGLSPITHGISTTGGHMDSEDFGDDGKDRLDQVQIPGVKVYEFEMEDEKEKLEAIEGYALEHVVGGKIRFRTNRQRYSPWYGKGEAGKWFVLPPKRELNCYGRFRFVEEFIIGFHGLACETSILSLGVVLRQVDQTNVFSNCWLDRVDSILDGPQQQKGGAASAASEIDEQVEYIKKLRQVHQRQFNTVLRMRHGDVEKALKRTLRLSQYMRYGDHTPESLRSVRVIDGLMKWFFNSMSKKLVRLNGASREHILAAAENGHVARGYMMIHQGNDQLKHAKKSILNLEQLIDRGKGKKPLNEAHIGRKRYLTINAELEGQRDAAKKAEDLIINGRTVVDQGLFKMPKLDTSEDSLDYYENLVRLAVVKDQIL